MTTRDTPADRPFQNLRPEAKPTPLSLETVSGWEQQFVRMRRWRDRVLSLGEGAVNDELVDYCLAFFVFCHSLKDWLEHSGGVPKAVLDEWIGRNPAMQLCHDICTRAKHFKVSRPKLDGGFQIMSESLGREQGSRVVISFNGFLFPLVDMVRQCDAFWESFIINYAVPDRLPQPGKSYK